MTAFVGSIVLIGLVFLPQWWVQRVFSQFRDNREDFAGTGGELAEYLIDQFSFHQALVKLSDSVNYFDPSHKTVSLTPDTYHGRSLTAIATAAHEFGHLVQLEEGNLWLRMRTRLARAAQKVDRLGMVAMILLPFTALLTRSPVITLLMVGAAFSGVLITILVQLVSLPMEFDASFGKALPLLKAGKFISEKDEPAVRKILLAAAFTYVASALASLLNLARWLRVVRR